MNLLRFAQSSGFKILALAKLSRCEYSLLFYFLNLSASGMDEVVSNEAELASLTGFYDNEINETLKALAKKGILKLHHGKSKQDTEHQSLRISFEFDTSRWQLDIENNGNEKDAIVYPFRREGKSVLKVFDGDKQSSHTTKKTETWDRVLRYFLQGRVLTDAEIEENKSAAKILIETHPVDQVLLFLRHFNLKIPSLSLLASSWQHFQEQFASETQKIDMLGARQKHMELDEKLRLSVKSWLEKSEKLELTEEEIGVLNILLKHRHPRRQLFWAYQLRSRYEQLGGFFEENANIMIPIASNGTIVRKGS